MSHHRPINQTVDPPGSLPCEADPDSEPPLAELLRNSGRQRKDLARELGFRNLGKGINLLWEIERGVARCAYSGSTTRQIEPPPTTWVERSSPSAGPWWNITRG
jgi:hypothetical protein